MFTALLVRKDGSARVFGTDYSSFGDAVAAINENWQHRNTPEKVQSYVVIDSDNTDATIIDHNAPAATSSGRVPKRPAIAA